MITGADTNAADIARTVFNKILEVTGRTPALVVSHLHRLVGTSSQVAGILDEHIFQVQVGS